MLHDTPRTDQLSLTTSAFIPAGYRFFSRLYRSFMETNIILVSCDRQWRCLVINF